MTRIGITMGCPAGIGPEIILKYFSYRKAQTGSQVVVLGDSGVLRKYQALLGINCPDITAWNPTDTIAEHTIPVFELSNLAEDKIIVGEPNHETSRAMARYINTGVELAQNGVIDGITTCPISKKHLNAAGYNFPGHTEMLGSLTNTSGFVMMMAGAKLRVTLVTIHCALRDVPEKITSDDIFHLISTTHLALRRDFAIKKPKIAVAGLNPHAGEDNLFGYEETEVITPAITKAHKLDLEVAGPLPPDTVFFKAAAGTFDAVICMYHDQGLIPFKLLHFEDGVNVTLGLPIVRTSVDHGTAYDIAGQGVANHKSLEEAVVLAAEISNNRNEFEGRSDQ